MGMFDLVDCEYSLPKVLIGGKIFPHTNQEFQTKDLMKCLAHYKITKDGRLHIRDDKFTNGEYIVGDYKDIDHHGIIHVYDIFHIKDTMYELNYRIKFTDGSLVEAFAKITSY